MAYGATHCYSEDLCRRFNSICIQEKSDTRSSWPWWTHSQYNNLYFRKRRNKKPLLEDIPVPDCLERGLPAGRLTRREHKICLLEASYSCSVRRDVAESAQHIERGDEDVCCESPGSVLRNQSFETRVSQGKAGPSGSQATCNSHGSITNDTICSRVLQSVGSDLIAPWLTPRELHTVEVAVGCSWDRGQAWHHGKVRNKAVASSVEHLLPIHGLDYLMELYSMDDIFSALWHLIPADIFSHLAVKHKHLKSIRKLMHLRS